MRARGPIVVVLAILAVSAGLPALAATCGSEPHRPACCCAGDEATRPTRDECPCSMRPSPSAPAVPGEESVSPHARNFVPLAAVDAARVGSLEDASHARGTELHPPGARDSVPLFLSDRAIRR